MKEVIANFLAKHANIDKDKIFNSIEIPPDSSLGDYAFPCFILAREMKKSPVDIATLLSSELAKKLPKEISGVSAAGPYLNFFVDKRIFLESTINQILKEKEKYGCCKLGKAKKVLVEHTSLNPNSDPHVGRIRNSLIGDCLSRIMRFHGFNVETHFYINDVSKQVAMLVLKCKGNEKFHDLLKRYVEITKELEKKPELEKEVFTLLEKFEKNEKSTRKKFKNIVKIAVQGQKKILEELGIKFDKFDYESDYIAESGEILKDLEKTGRLFTDEEGRKVLDEKGFGLEQKMKAAVFVLARSDGTGLYPLRDIAYTIEKLGKAEKNILVLGEDQKLYFEQVKAALKILKHNAPEIVHYSYVLIQTKEGPAKMSTRKGELVLMSDFMKEAREKAEKEIKKRKTKGNAEKIGNGAIKFAMLRNDPNKNIVFDWDTALNFEGESGPYLQYSYARASSIMRKSKTKAPGKIKVVSLCEKEVELAKKMAEFPEVAEQVYNKMDPSLLANYTFQLSQVFNEFYHTCPVLESMEKEQRLGVVQAFMDVQKLALSLLGIEIMQEM
jgi:arginyl-tRNA synthetase